MTVMKTTMAMTMIVTMCSDNVIPPNVIWSPPYIRLLPHGLGPCQVELKRSTASSICDDETISPSASFRLAWGRVSMAKGR